MAFDVVVAVPTFICSLLSLIADSAFALCYGLCPPEKHFRQALIINLLLADWINSLNNTISGAIALSRRNDKAQFTKGAACTANGYIGQFSVQAIDFNILIIAIAVLLTVRRSGVMMAPPWWQIVVICIIPWIPSIITSEIGFKRVRVQCSPYLGNIALGLDAYGPVSGNWCWIKESLVLRYTLTHGWRIAIFIATISIYTYVYLHLKRTFGKVNITTGDSAALDDLQLNTIEDVPEEGLGTSERPRGPSVCEASDSDKSLLSLEGGRFCDEVGEDDVQALTTQEQILRDDTRSTSCPNFKPLKETNAPKKRAIRKMLLLNGYPILYIILWIPGIVNRIVEIVKGKSPVWLEALQASTQLVGFANALTYAWNEQLCARALASCKRNRRRNRRLTVAVLPSRDSNLSAR